MKTAEFVQFDPQLDYLAKGATSFIDTPTLGEDGTLTSFYQKNGYLVLPDLLSPSEISSLCDETLAICSGARGIIEGVAKALETETATEILSRYLCIHFPHKVSDVMHEYLAPTRLVDVLTEIIGENVKCMQSMLFIKSAGKPGQAWHQDEVFIPTRDVSLTGAWIALDDATVENGCLWIIPGSHKPAILWELHDHEDTRFDCTVESRGFPYSDADAIPVPVKAGSCVFFSGHLLHRSFPNRARTGYRRVLVNHYMSAESLLPWFPSEEGEHMAITDYRDIVMVAGSDPYAWKGITNRSKPMVRRSREGGCLR